MAHRFAELMFTGAVKAQQTRMGSRGNYEQLDHPGAHANDRLGPSETGFIAAREIGRAHV